VNANAIIEAVTGVTRVWCKQRKAEERESSRAMRRLEAMTRHDSANDVIKRASFEVMQAAYLHASTNNTLPAKARQIMYAARRRVLEITGGKCWKEASYFTQTLLPAFMEAYPDLTADWNVVFDARGHFVEPHTHITVPLGTLDVREYLAEVERHVGGSVEVIEVPGTTLYPTRGPRHRFSGILFIEKEGFDELFEAVQLAERYDLAIMSTKGMSVTASRLLVDRLCALYGVPVLVLHDFDKSGFSILGTLGRDTRRYRF
jgi:hypothetical protein